MVATNMLRARRITCLALALLAAPSLAVVLPTSSFPLPATGDALRSQTEITLADPLPVVVWHGLGDSSDAEGLQSIAELITDIHPGTYVHLVSASDGSDRQASWFGNVTEQVDFVCHQLAKDRILATAPAIDAIGFSQGGQFLRAYVQRCGHWAPKIRNLLTFGSQHNGIAEFQRCSGPTDFLCNSANALLKGNVVWSDFVQSRLVPAQYYRNPNDYENYLAHSNFLADVNNEREEKNVTYAKNLAELGKLVLIVFEDDKTVIPKESGWFADVDVESGNVTYLRDREIYTEDWIGLKALDEKDGIVFDTVAGAHMRLEDRDLKRLFRQYLGPADHKSVAESGPLDSDMEL